MPHASGVATAMLVRLGTVTNRTYVLPLLVFYPTSRCNSRCVSCDWWRRSGAGDLSPAEVEQVAAALPELGTRVVAFSGGEPLLRPEVFAFARMFSTRGMTLHLLTSGILLERFAGEVATHFARVTVSLDAASESLYAQVRGVAALEIVEKGVARLRSIAPDVPITARTTLHRANFRELPRIVTHGKGMALDSMSFLAADVSSGAFGREGAPDLAALALSREEVREFAETVERTIVEHRAAFESGFIAQSPDALRRLPRYYSALLGGEAFPPVACNAPWVSVVLEANGSVRPCFFHEPVGNVRESPLATIVADNLRRFRGSLDVGSNAVCRRCVCSLKTGWRRAPWDQ